MSTVQPDPGVPGDAGFVLPVGAETGFRYVVPAADAVPPDVAPPLEPPSDVQAVRAELAAAVQEMENLRIAVASNRRIGMAVGVLMALRKCPEEEAFELLRRASNRRNVKLREVAEDVIRSGTVD